MAAINWELTTAKSGRPTLRASLDGVGRWIHSQRDPEAEASVLVDDWWQGPGMYMVLGLGLGYHVAELQRRLRGSAGEIIVFEPSSEIYEIAREAGVLEPLLDARNVRIVSGEGDIWRVLATRNLLTISGHSVLCVHPVLHHLFPDEYERVLAGLRSEVNRQLVNARTLLFWDLVWVRNTILNVPFVVNHPAASILQGDFDDLPAFIVSAGPSLDKNVTELRKAKGKGLIIAVGTALRSVLKAGVSPDLVVSVDGGEPNYQHFRNVPADDIPLVFDPMLHPRILKEHRGPKLVVKTYNMAYDWLRPVVEEPMQLIAGGSVATVALDLAVKLGCNPVVLVGQDLAYDEEGRTHASATVYGKARVQTGAPGLIKVPGNAGTDVWTSRSLYSFLTWFERYLAFTPPHLRAINATEGGARINGAPCQSLADTIEQECRRNVNVRDVIDRAMAGWEPRTSLERVADFLAESVQTLRRMAKNSRDGMELSEDLADLLRNNLLESRRARQLLKKLSRVNSELHSDSAPRDVLHGALYRTILRVLRDGDGTPSEIEEVGAPLDPHAPDKARALLEKSQEIYASLEDAASRVASVIEASMSSWVQDDPGKSGAASAWLD